MAEKRFWVGSPNTIALSAVAPEVSKVLSEWLSAISLRIGNNPFQIPTYTVATVPDATMWGDSSFSSIIAVSDETGGYTLAFSDGTNWRRFQDRAIVS